MSGPVANNIFKASGVIAAAAGGLNWDSTVLTALTNLTVTVQNAGGNKYFIGGVQQQTLNLLEGFTYKFDQSDSSNSGHPFRFSTTSGGTHSGGSEYTTGVTTSGTPGNAGAYTQIVVASGAPVLYYYCTNHNYMGGTANTVSETVKANNGYWIDTTSTTCTITLPSSPSKGDQIILVDYARTWGTNKITIDSNGSNYQGQDDSYNVEYSTSGEVLNIVYSDGTKGWIPQDDDEVADATTPPPTQKGIFFMGDTGSALTDQCNIINSNGVVQSATSGVGTARGSTSGCMFGGDKAIFAYGNTNVSNKVSNQGVVAADTSGVGDNRAGQAGCSFGGDKGIFGYANNNATNLVSNTGVIASDTSAVGTGRPAMGGASFGTGYSNGIWAYGQGGYNISNIISTVGIVQSNTAGVGTARYSLAGTLFGGDRGIFGYGYSNDNTNITNKVSNTGVVASDTSGVGTSRYFLAGSPYGGDKGIWGYGAGPGGGKVSVTNLISNTGVVSADVTGVGLARFELAGAGFSLTA